MLEYIYKRQEPSSVPKILLPTLKDIDISQEDIVLCVPTDRSKEGMAWDTYIMYANKQLHVLSGTVSSVMKKGRNERSFNLLSHEKYDGEELLSFFVEENVSSLTLYAKTKGDGGVKVVANGTLTVRGELQSGAKYLTQLIQEGTLTPEPDSDEESLFCPKCGQRYVDPANKVCTECLDRKKIVARTAELLKKYKLKIAIIIAMLIFTGAVGVVTPYFSATFFYDKVLGDKQSVFYGAIVLVVGIVVGTRLLSTLISVVHNIVTSVIAAELVYDLKKTIFSSIQRLSVSFFTSRKTGGLMTQVSGDATTIYSFFCDTLPYFLVNIIQIIAVAIIMFVMNPTLSALSLITFPVAFFAVKSLFAVNRKYHNRRFAKQRSMTSTLSDILTGIRVVKAFAKEDDETRRFNKKSQDAARTEKQVSNFSAVAFPSVNFLLYISNLVVWGVGGVMVMKGQMTYGVLAAFIAYMNMVYSPMYSLVGMVSQASDSVNAMGRLVEIMDATPDVIEKADPVRLPELQGHVEFKNVSFGYDNAKTILKDVSFDIPAGTSLGIVGKTGAGKSTLANLLIRLYDVGEGGIYIDGVNVKDISFDDLHKSTAIVSQETYLFIGTVYDNIAYACPDATPEDVINAAKIAGAHEFITKMPEGYETMIGLGYMNLSGGERQRISIARALLKNPKILILDEATAAMDTQTERNIQNALERLTNGRTTIMIAHRLSTLRDVDKLIVIDNGAITEAGTHDELIRKKGDFYKLYKIQLDAMKNIGIEE